MLATEFMLLLAAAASAAPLAALSHPPAASLVAPHVQLQEEQEQLQTTRLGVLTLVNHGSNLSFQLTLPSLAPNVPAGSAGGRRA